MTNKSNILYNVIYYSALIMIVCFSAIFAVSLSHWKAIHILYNYPKQYLQDELNITIGLLSASFMLFFKGFLDSFCSALKKNEELVE